MSGNITATQLATILGISRQRVNELARKGKITREQDGNFNLVKVNAALRKNLDAHQAIRSLGQTKQASSADIPGGEGQEETFAEAQRRNEWLKVQKNEMELQSQREEVYDKQELNAALGERIIAMRQKLSELPKNFAQRLALEADPITIINMLSAEIDSTLNDLSEWRPNA